jgi:hypothetical protein
VADTVVTVIVRARDEFSKTFQQFQGSALDVAKAAGVLSAVSAAAAGGLVAISAAAGARANDLQVLGQRLALSASEVDKLKFAAEQLDVNFGAVTSSIGFFQRTLFAARSGSTEAVQTLRALGFSLEEIESGLGGTQAGFRETVDRLRDVSDEGTRAGLMFRIFGRGAAEIRPIIEGGTAALDANAKKLEELNAVVSVTAGVLGDEFGDAVDSSKKQVEAFQSAVAEALLPTLTAAVVGTQKFVAGIIQFAKENPAVIRTVFTLATGVSVLAGSLGTLTAAVAIAKGAMATFGVSTAALAASGGPIALAIIALGALAAAFVYAREKAKEPFQIKVGISTPEEVGAELGRLSQARQDALRELEAARAAANAVRPVGARDLSGGREAAQDQARKAAAAGAAVAAAKAKVDELEKSIGTLQTTAATAFGRAAGGADDLGLAAVKAADPVQKLVDLVESLSGPKEVEITVKTLNADLSSEGLKPVRGLPAPPFDFRPNTPLDNEPQPEIDNFDLAEKLQDAADVAGGALHDALEQVGVDVAALNAPIESLRGTLEVIGEVLATSFRGAFDPLRSGIEDAQAAAFEFGDNAIATLDASIKGFVFEGQKGLKTLGDGFLAAGRSAAQLVQQVIILTIRTLILKAISGGLFSGGGEVGVDPGTGAPPRLAAHGGLVRAYAAGGEVEAAPAPGGLFRALRSAAAGGLVLALAAGGEVVAPGPAGARAGGAPQVIAAHPPVSPAAAMTVVRLATGGRVLELAAGGEVASAAPSRPSPPAPGTMAVIRLAAGGPVVLEAPEKAPRIVRAASGGEVRGYAGGGGIAIDGRPGGQVHGPGTATSDDIPARLSDREFVVRTAVVERPGVLPFLRKLNAGSPEALEVLAPLARRFAAGGEVGPVVARAFAGGGLVSSASAAPLAPAVNVRETAAIIREALVYAPPAPAAAASAKAPITLHVHARDADSVRRDLGPGGRSYRELRRLADEGRV